MTRNAVLYVAVAVALTACAAAPPSPPRPAVPGVGEVGVLDSSWGLRVAGYEYRSDVHNVAIGPATGRAYRLPNDIGDSYRFPDGTRVVVLERVDGYGDFNVARVRAVDALHGPPGRDEDDRFDRAYWVDAKKLRTEDWVHPRPLPTEGEVSHD